MSETQTARTRLSKPNDARAVRSREALRAACLELIEDRPFEEISIKDITTAAGVSYPVFFRQFTRKEDLLEDIAAGEVRHLIEHTMPLFLPGSPHAPVMALCDYVQEHRALWTRLLTTGATAAMRKEFIRIALDIAQSRQRENPRLPSDLASTLVVSSIFEILSWWLRQPLTYPVENIVLMLETLVVKPITQPMELKPA